MKILVLEGSPNRHGSSNFLAEEFIRGAKEAGHAVEVIDAAHADLHPVPDASAAGMRAPASRRTTWSSSADRSWARTCWYL